MNTNTMFIERLTIVICVFVLISTRACKTLLVTDHKNRYELQKLSLIEQTSLLQDSPCVDSGRAIYKSEEGVYVYHFQDSLSGIGYWILSSSFCEGTSGALAFRESWAVKPELTESFSIADNASRSTWINHAGEMTFQFSCTDRHNSVYFESSAVLQPQLTGFYIARDIEKQFNDETSSTNTVYVMIKHQATDAATYLFHLPSQVTCSTIEQAVQTDITENQHCELTTTWLIGDRYGVDAGLAYTITTQTIPFGTTAVPQVPSISAQWKFVQANGLWAVDPAARLISAPQELNMDLNNSVSLFETVQSIRSLRTDYPPGMITSPYFFMHRFDLSTVHSIATNCSSIYRSFIFRPQVQANAK